MWDVHTFEWRYWSSEADSVTLQKAMKAGYFLQERHVEICLQMKTMLRKTKSHDLLLTLACFLSTVLSYVVHVVSIVTYEHTYL